MIVLTKSERRALLVVALILVISGVVQWSRPHAVRVKQFDYTLQDSLFKILSADTVSPAAKAAAPAEKPKSKKRKKKRAKQLLKPHSIDINKAGASELERLPYIGPKTARAIIEYRQANGPFKSVDELDNVKRIGPKTIERIKPYIYLTFPKKPDGKTDSGKFNGK
ncbi:MAG: helix-hairpin-helix domain-containing protein [Calditrichaeota bacterium]|nr:helix-hairpin-helix domain-containing protein [Calditrichota bacterium]